ncbi:VTT domain-containing protein [Actinoplanes sp. NPDC026619]|uniref:DedA family protein n=1 Tax=Actinoplanes sp. NPDC026619 TaxID=3155798 RepID=UPI0033BFD812
MPVLDDLLGGLPPVLVYAVVAALVAAESAVVAGLVLPAATALIALGLLANAGTVQIVPALLVAVGAAMLGGTAAFFSGRRRGARVRVTRLGRWIGDRRWDRAERLFTRHGGRAIFLGQWIVGARTLIPRLAGVNGVRYKRFAVWHTPAAVLWSLWMVGASYLAGASYDLLAARAGRAGGALAALTTIVVALILAGRWLGRHPRPFHALADALSASRAAGMTHRFARPDEARFHDGAPGYQASVAWAGSGRVGVGRLVGLGARSGWGAQAGSGTRSGSGAQAGSGTRSGSGAQAGSGTQSGSGAQAGSGTQSGSGAQAGSGTQSGSGARAGSRSGSGTQSGSGAQAGSQSGPGVRLRRRGAGAVVDLGLGGLALFSLGAVLVLVIPVVVRFSGLGDADVAITNWARSQWTSDGYLFALDAATFADPGVLFAVAAVVSVVRWWVRRRRGVEGGLLTALGPVLPTVVLAAAYSLASPPAWQAWQTPTSVVFPSVAEFDGYIPFDVAGPMASMAVGHTAQLAGAVGLLAWMLAGHLAWKWRVTVWTVAAIYVVTCAGSWVYLGWSRSSETVAALLIGAAWAALNAAIWSAPGARPAPQTITVAPAVA